MTARDLAQSNEMLRQVLMLADVYTAGPSFCAGCDLRRHECAAAIGVRHLPARPVQEVTAGGAPHTGDAPHSHAHHLLHAAHCLHEFSKGPGELHVLLHPASPPLIASGITMTAAGTCKDVPLDEQEARDTESSV